MPVSFSPSTNSIGGAPSRTASFRASDVNEPVVMMIPLSARPVIAAEIAYVAWRDRPSVLLALKENFETDEGVDLEHADTVDAAVSGSASDGDFLKTGFAQQSLAESLEPGSRERLQRLSQFFAVVGDQRNSVSSAWPRLRRAAAPGFGLF